MGRPRRNSNKSDSGSTAGNVYNASLAAAQQQKALDSTSSLASSATSTTSNNVILVPAPSNSSTSTSLTPQLDAISLIAASEIENERKTVSAETTPSAKPILAETPQTNTSSSQNSSAAIHRRSLSIAELVSLVSTRNSSANVPHTTTTPTSSTSALNALNLPDALRSTLEKADSPILNALLPLIRQKLAAKTALSRRNSAVDPGQTAGSTASLDSQMSRRPSTSARSEDHRLSHKLAERKRRKEMKDVFDGLKNVLPPGVPKSSKWEILNEASGTIDDLLAQEQALLNQRNELLKRINETTK